MSFTAFRTAAMALMSPQAWSLTVLATSTVLPPPEAPAVAARSSSSRLRGDWTLSVLYSFTGSGGPPSSLMMDTWAISTARRSRTALTEPVTYSS